MAFVHLHNHTDYSLLDGATRVHDMVARAVELGMPAVAITDHGHMYGVPVLAKVTDEFNQKDPAYQQWYHDKLAFEAGETPDAPDQSDARAYAQWQKDVAAWGETRSLDAVKPPKLIKPIYGCEVYFTPDSELRRDRKPELYHMILLAKNEQGYQNLMKLVSKAATTGFYYKPRLTLEWLKEHSEGLIGTSACVAGVVSKHILNGNIQEAEKWARTFKDIFAPGDFYIEIQEHLETWNNGWTDRKLSEELVRIASELGLKVIATNDFHYLRRQDAYTQDIVECIGTNNKITDDTRLHMTQTAPGEGEYYMKTEEEMRALFDWYPAALENTLEIAEKCTYEIDWNRMYLPKFPGLREGESSEERFRLECEAGLEKRYGKEWKEREVAGESVLQRFEHEYNIICSKGFADYFLIVQEYTTWAKDHGISVGPGRGSAAGSIVAFALDITTIDPLENGLMFERFLSPERSEMPDIDSDFEKDRRGEVIDHVREVYGTDHVCRVITYNKLKAANAVRDAARVLDYPLYLTDAVAKLIPKTPGTKLKHVIEEVPGDEGTYNPDLAKRYAEDEKVKEVIDAALSIEGLVRNEGLHACAVLIAPTPVNEHVPTKYSTKEGCEITEYEGTSVAEMGLLKMDFLGLSNLTIISKAIANIKKSYPTQADLESMPPLVKRAVKEGATSVDIDVDKIPFDDPKVFELLQSGMTGGVFQIDSLGMRAKLKSMQPTEYRQIVALIALYRPGPLNSGMVDAYIRRMHGKEKIEMYDNRLAPILNETYGTMVYQEQVMQIAMRMSGFSAGESDSRIRKPVAKKKIDLLKNKVFSWEDGREETTEAHWIDGAVRNGYSEAVARRIWDDVLEFASYAFNKSHSAGYAVVVMQTAWLKTHFPHEYWSAVLTVYGENTDKRKHYLNEVKEEGIKILPPDINESGAEFTATREGIRIGLQGLKGVGEKPCQDILEEREKNGPYTNLLDLLQRNNLTKINRGVIESLILSGAFDSTGYPRLQLERLIDKSNPNNLIDMVQKTEKKKAGGQKSFFDMTFDDDSIDMSEFGINMPEPDGQEYEHFLKLAKEHDIIGLYISDHPLANYRCALERARDFSLLELNQGYEKQAPDGTSYIEQVPENKQIWIAGMMKNYTKRFTKKNDPMATFSLEDLDAEVEVVVFPKTFKEAEKIFSRAETEDFIFLRLRGYYERNDADVSDRPNQFIVHAVEELAVNEDANKRRILEITLPTRRLNRLTLSNLQQTFKKHPGVDRIKLLFVSSGGASQHIEVPTQVDAQSPQLVAEIRVHAGDDAHIAVL